MVGEGRPSTTFARATTSWVLGASPRTTKVTVDTAAAWDHAAGCKADGSMSLRTGRTAHSILVSPAISPDAHGSTARPHRRFHQAIWPETTHVRRAARGHPGGNTARKGAETLGSSLEGASHLRAEPGLGGSRRPAFVNRAEAVDGRPSPTMTGSGIAAPYPSIFSAARNALCGMSTLPNWRIRFLPSFCFSSSFRLREMSPP